MVGREGYSQCHTTGSVGRVLLAASACHVNASDPFHVQRGGFGSSVEVGGPTGKHDHEVETCGEKAVTAFTSRVRGWSCRLN